MTPQACLSPIDPQIPTRDGRYVPAQALLLLVDELQKQCEKAMSDGRPIPWTAVRIIDSIDKKELGDAITASHYSTMMASEFLLNYKFRNWGTRETTGLPVTADYRQQRATDVGNSLASHDRPKIDRSPEIQIPEVLYPSRGTKMIDATLLRKLGWRDELIEEVTRVAGVIRRASPPISSTVPPRYYPRHQSASALFVDAELIQTPTLTVPRATPESSQRTRKKHAPVGFA